MLDLTKKESPDEIISAPGRYTSFWKKIFRAANEKKASDIHAASIEEGLLIRFRIDGQLTVIEKVTNRSAASELIVTLKRIADADTGTRRIAQDTSFKLDAFASKYRFALSPGGNHGECVVMRIIRDEEPPILDNLGMSPKALEDLRWAANQSQGFLLVTGPTGSGKSTTLQASIMDMDRYGLEVIAIEDPIERELPGVTHWRIRKGELDWDDAINTAMRSDPDVILVGEIRDELSASLAVKGANTGHLVMSTLHTNSVVDTIDRLIQLKVRDFQIADNLLYVSAQRLLNTLCPHCKIRHGDYFIRNVKGCEACVLGIKGRKGIIEYLVNPEPEHIMTGNKEALRECLSQDLFGELRKCVEKGEVCHSLFENAVKKGKF